MCTILISTILATASVGEFMKKPFCDCVSTHPPPAPGIFIIYYGKTINGQKRGAMSPRFTPDMQTIYGQLKNGHDMNILGWW